MKKRLAAFFAAVFLLFSLSETVEASASTYRNQLSRTECELYDAMVSYLPQGYDSFRCELSQPAIYATVEEANSSLQMQVSRAYEAFYRDYPEVFWLDKSGISFSAPSRDCRHSLLSKKIAMRVLLSSIVRRSCSIKFITMVNLVVSCLTGRLSALHTSK